MNKMTRLLWAARFENHLNVFKHLWNEMAPDFLVWHTSIEAHLNMVAEMKKMLELTETA
jgi:hypothetical protein